MPTSRVEAFSDGVFAVAITLLVLDLATPMTSGSLIGALADKWPQFAAFAISFVVIGIVWVNHHTVFHRLKRVDRPLLFINLGLLMSVVLIPFVTSLFALYLTHRTAQAAVAGALFNGALLLMALSFLAVNLWVNTHPELRRAAGPRQTIWQTARFAAGNVAYAVCIGLAFVSAPLVLIIDGAVAAYYVADQLGTASEDT